MKIKTLISAFILFGFIVQTGFSYDNGDDETALLLRMIEQYGQAYVLVAVSDIKNIDYFSRNFSISRCDDKYMEIAISPHTVEHFLSQGIAFDVADNSNSKSVIMASSLEEAMTWEAYPAYSQYCSIIQYFADNYPDLCRVDTVGISVSGLLIPALKISDNAGDDEDEPEVLYSSTIHGDELAGYVMMLRLADTLLKGYVHDDRIKNIVDNIQLWIVPLANPDGTYYRNPHEVSDIITMPRRNNFNDVDLNRNFPDMDGSSGYCQKETADMISFMKKHHFILSANFHSGREVANYPWDRYAKLHADNGWFEHVCRKYADTVHVYCSEGYFDFLDNGITNGYAWYNAYGTRQDYVTYFLRGREITVELSDIKQTSTADLPVIWSYNIRSMLGYVENALYGIKGFVTDKNTHLPVAAKITVLNHDKDNSEVYSDEKNGRYRRLLAAGNYNIVFSSSGYVADTVNVAVETDKCCDLNVALTPLTGGKECSDIDIVVYPNPAFSGDNVKIKLSARPEGHVTIDVYNISGQLLRSYEDRVGESVFNVSTEGLSAGIYIIRVKDTVNGMLGAKQMIIY